jgi:uncharacterized repeat protein (TIGR02543 family)
MCGSCSFRIIAQVLFFSAICNLFNCELPPSPDDPSRTKVELLLRNSNWVQSNSSISDSTGKPIQIGLAVYLPDYVDSIQMFFRAGDVIVFDTVINKFNSETTDTIWKQMTFFSAGNKTVTVNAYSSELHLSPITANITIYKRNIFDPQENHAPNWIKDTIVTDLRDTSKYSLNLYSLCSDPDGDSVAFDIEGESVAGDTIIGKEYMLQAIPLDIGKKIIYLIAKDVKAAKDTLYLIVIIEESDTFTQSKIHTVAYDGNTSVSGGVPVDSGKYKTGTVVIVKGNTGNLVKTGYTFAGWNTTSDGTGTVYAIGSTFSMGSANVVLYARWTQSPTFTVIYNGNTNASGTVPVDSGKYESGTAVTLKANTGNLIKTGYTFAGWNTAADGSGTAHVVGSTFNMGSTNVVLYARWIITQYTVKFNSQGGSTIDSMNVNHGEMVSKPSDPIRSGYVFGGWYKESDCVNVWSFTESKVDGSFTLYAKWSEGNYLITYNLNGGTNGNNPTAYNITSSAIILEDPVRSGYTFDGWYSSSSFSGAVVTTIPSGSTGDKVFWAKWTLTSYSITYNLNNGTNGSNPSSYSITSQTITLDNPTMNGYDFGGWYTNSTLTGTAVTTIPTGSTGTKAFWAMWTIKQYSVIFNSQGGSAVASQTVSYGGVASAPLNPIKTGNTFGGWYKEPSCTNVWTFNTDVVTGAVTLHAKWITAYCQLTVLASSGGSISAPVNTPVNIAYGIPTTITASPNTGYSFLNWTYTASTSIADPNNSNTTVTLTGNATVTANFSRITCVVSFSSQGIIASTLSVNYGGYVTENKLTRNCYDYGGWFKDSSFTDPWRFSIDQVVGATTLYCKWNVSQIALIHPSWDSDINVCINDPIDVGTDCAAKYEWFTDGWGMGEYFCIDSNSNTWSGQGTKALRYNNGVAGCNVYCIVTDQAGRQVRSGVWSWGITFCP